MRTFLTGLTLFALAATSLAQYRLMGETVTSAPAGSESWIFNYADNATLLSNSPGSYSPTQVDWPRSHHTAELAFDGKYRLFGETSTAATAGNESIVYTYDTYADFVSNNWSSWSATQINWNEDYHTAGFEYDGKYRLLGETTTANGAGFESVIYSYNTFADLLANNFSSFSVTQLNWNDDIHTAGLAFDGKYRLMGETATTASAGFESWIYTFDTFADLVNNNASGFSPTQFDWDSSYHTAGFTYQPVPEPTTVGIMVLSALALKRRRK